MTKSITVVIVEKTGALKTLTIKDYKEEDLYKKCGFKVSEGFTKQCTWEQSLDKIKYKFHLYAKDKGKANTENKYDFPPPVDTVLYFGNALITCEKNKEIVDLDLTLWNKAYEKLFGGFDDVESEDSSSEEESEEEEKVVKPLTKHGFEKDGFVIDSEDDEDDEEDYETADEDDDDSSGDKDETSDDDLEIEDVGSEISEEEYDYSDDEK